MKKLIDELGFGVFEAGSADASGLPAGAGSYVLVLRLPEAVRLAVGRLGEFDFEAGLYVYCGSALGGLRARLARHLRVDRRVHWHVDYLNSSLAGAVVERVLWLESRVAVLECEWAAGFAGLPGASLPVRGFGSSDCKCESHLVRVGEW